MQSLLTPNRVLARESACARSRAHAGRQSHLGAAICFWRVDARRHDRDIVTDLSEPFNQVRKANLHARYMAERAGLDEDGNFAGRVQRKGRCYLTYRPCPRPPPSLRSRCCGPRGPAKEGGLLHLASYTQPVWLYHGRRQFLAINIWRLCSNFVRWRIL